MEIITGYTGENHVTSADDASLYRGIVGIDDYVLDVGNKFAATIIDNNTVRIMDGDLLIQGHQARIRANDYNEVTIENGTPGKIRHDFIAARYKKNTETGIESITLGVIKGTPGEAGTVPWEIKQEDLKVGGTERDYLLYRVVLDGISLTDLIPMFNVVTTYASLLEGGQRYPATLQNGWTHNPTYPLRYSKDHLGYVTISGRVDAGAIEGGTVICTLPSGYRPIYFMAIPFYDLQTGNGIITDIRINSNGDLAVISSPDSLQATSRISINIMYKGF